VYVDGLGGMSVRVLLIEDHGALREMIAAHLVERGYAIDAVADAEHARSALAAAAYDAAVVDLGLPDADGIELVAHIRAHTAGRLPAIILTARDSVAERVRGLNAGADDYIIKPFDLIELEARLRAVLRRPGTRDAVAYSCGALHFDSASRTAIVNGVTLDLSRREVDLLEELLRARERVVVKDVLEERLYSFQDSVSGNALEAVVSRLRKKLTGVGAGIRLETKRGIGYRLVAEEEP
jgi:two-component system response regulator QseB